MGRVCAGQPVSPQNTRQVQATKSKHKLRSWKVGKIHYRATAAHYFKVNSILTDTSVAEAQGSSL